MYNANPFRLIALSLSLAILSGNMNSRAEAGADMENGSSNNTSTLMDDPLLGFSANLFKQIVKENNNAILSPLSVHQALNLVLLGADKNSETANELIQGLGYSRIKGDISKVHEEYEKVLSMFRQVNEVAREKIKEEAAEKPLRPVLHRKGTNQAFKPPLIDIWSTLIAKGKGQVLPKYSNDASKYYNSSVERISNPQDAEKLVDKVNKWAREAGFDNGVITEAELKANFSALLLTAIQIQAFWFEDFYETEQNDTFFDFGLQDKPNTNAKQLAGTDLRGKYIEFAPLDSAHHPLRAANLRSVHGEAIKELENLSFYAVEAPLQGNVSLTIFEPLKWNGISDALAKLVGKLLDEDGKVLNKALHLLDTPEGVCRIQRLEIPKFKFESDINLKPALAGMNIKRVFSKTDAQVSNIIDHKVYVDGAKHQAVIEVNKYGLKAAGVTKISFTQLSSFIRDEKIILNVNRPFMFLIRYNKLPLIIGQLVHL